MAAQGRRGARRLLVQALYQHLVGGHGGAELDAQFSDDPGFARIDAEYFRSLMFDVLRHEAELDERISALADRPVAQLDPVERAILWIGATELLRRPDVPRGVVINEAVELAKQFGAQDSHRYVNAVLDGLAAGLPGDGQSRRD